MRRAALNPRRAKHHYNYTVAEAAKLFGVHRNTVRTWIAAGLETVRTSQGLLLLGEDIRAFLDKRRRARRTRTPPGAIYCMRCRVPRQPAGGMIELLSGTGPTANVRALCDHCGALMHRRVTLTGLAAAGFAALGTTKGESDLVDSHCPSVNCNQSEAA